MAQVQPLNSNEDKPQLPEHQAAAYSVDAIMELLIEWGKKMVPERPPSPRYPQGDPGFVMHESLRPLAETLIRYFANDPEFYNSQQVRGALDLKKGILISGKPGTGKTLILSIFSEMFSHYRLKSIKEMPNEWLANSPFKYFELHSACDMAMEVSVEGPRSIWRYGKKCYRKNPGLEEQRLLGPIFPRHICIDDIGSEVKSVHYGNRIDSIGQILTDRCAEMPRGMITHGTTNLGWTELESFYSSRVTSRIKQLFNVLVLDGEDLRK